MKHNRLRLLMLLALVACLLVTFVACNDTVGEDTTADEVTAAPTDETTELPTETPTDTPTEPAEILEGEASTENAGDDGEES